jgi:hypothetical protein
VNATIVGLAVFATTFAASLAGMWLRKTLPAHHLDAESKDTIKVTIGLIVTMTALVLGLITASAKSSFDAMDTAVRESAIQVLTLDRTLARYGPETQPIREGLKKVLHSRMEMIWPTDSSGPVDLDPMHSGAASLGEGLADAIRNLKPDNDLQRAQQSRALDLAEGLLETRWMVLGGTENSVPMPFLLVLMFWLTITFGSFGLFAPPRPVALSVLFVCAASVGSALFLVLEMDTPFSGLLKVSPNALASAYAHLAQ